MSRLEAALVSTAIRTPRIPVISNVDAEPHADPDTIKRILARQVNTDFLFGPLRPHLVANIGLAIYDYADLTRTQLCNWTRAGPIPNSPINHNKSSFFSQNYVIPKSYWIDQT